MSQPTIQHALELALQHHGAGRLHEAAELFRQILTRQPDHADALHNLGVIACQMGRRDMAVELMQRSIWLRPSEALFHNNLGNVFKDQGRLDEAIACFQGALAAKPDDAEAHNNLGNAFKDQRRLDEAIGCYQRALALKPDVAAAHYNLGNIFTEQGRLDEAIACYQRALALKPDLTEAHNNLGLVFKKQGRLDKSIGCYQRALALRPDLAEAHNNLGNAFKNRGRLDEAIASFQRVLALKPDHPEALNNLGNAFKSRGLCDAALASFQQALALKPDLAETHNNLGLVCKVQGQLDKAIAHFQQALTLKPDLAEAHDNLGNAFKDQGRLDEAIASFRRALALRPDDFPETYSNLIYTLQYHPGYDTRAIAEECRHWNRRYAEPLKKFILPHSNDRSPERRLRIGYVSPDFRSHAQCFFVLPLLESHDHRQFEIHCYSSVVSPDQVTERHARCADQWHNVVGWGNENIAEQVRRDRIDLLVDLTLHMAQNRLPLFARKPAPVQVTWLGYPGTTGLKAMDYRLTDSFMDPLGSDDGLYSEKSVRLPDSFFVYDPLAEEPQVNSLPAAERGSVTFGCLNNPCKLNDPVIRLWAPILKAVNGSRLLLLAHEESQRERVRSLLGREGIDGDRVEFEGYLARPDYLKLYHRIDVGLDMVPYNGHTTSLDALWMGVPVVSLVGQTAVGRAGLSILSNLKLAELAAHSAEEYVQIAVTLAENLPRLAELRTTLRQRMEASPLMDGPRFARSMEAAYRQMWRRWCGDSTML